MAQSFNKICRQLMRTNNPKDTDLIVWKALKQYGEYRVSIQENKKGENLNGR